MTDNQEQQIVDGDKTVDDLKAGEEENQNLSKEENDGDENKGVD